MTLKLTGYDILGQDDALRLREELGMDELDQSTEEITIVVDKNIIGISTNFGLDFLRPSAHNIWDENDLDAFSDSISTHGNSYQHALIFPPYKFIPEDENTDTKVNFHRFAHRLLGCICAIYADWEWKILEKENKPEIQGPQ